MMNPKPSIMAEYALVLHQGGISPQRHREREGFFGGTRGHALRQVRRFAFETPRRGLRWPCKYIHPQACTETTSNAARNSSGILCGRPLWRFT